MAKTITTSVSVAVSGDGMGLPASPIVPPSFPFTNNGGTSGGEAPLVLSTGNNTVNVPAGHRGVMLIPPAGSVVTLTLKGIAGDTGVSVDPVLGLVWFFPAGTASFVLNASAGVTLNAVWL